MPQLHALFVIGATHPALPGHFPGAPVVPGVVVLDQVIGLLESLPDFHGDRLDLPQVKFVEPLLPGELAAIEIDVEGDRARFRVQRGDTAIANGSLHWHVSP